MVEKKDYFRSIKSPYLIAEIGINHNGDLQIAKRLMDAVFACGWDCAKFQKKNPDLCIPESHKNMIRKTPWGDKTYLEYKKILEFDRTEYEYIDRYCKEKPIDWTASVWDLESLYFIDSFDVEFIKIPSAKLTDYELLASAANTGRPIMLSTGMSTLEEIDAAVIILKTSASDFMLMHCNSSYPAKKEETNLLTIKSLRDRYGCEIGYSGHEYGLEPTTYAAVLGAKVIERHITISHELWGTDQASSIEPHGMDMLYKRIQDIDKMLGDGKKMVYDSELEVMKKLRR
jgi:N-acetylneuraminate synthase